MSVETEAPPKLSGNMAQLCRHLAEKDKVPVAGLPKDLGSPALLAQGLALGLLEVGRPHYSEVVTNVRVRKGPDGKNLYDEAFRQVVDRDTNVLVEEGWSWTNLRGRKSLRDVLAEDAKLPENVRLHVRLTTSGLAATAV